MSRNNVFRRIASWLKKTANLNEYRRQRDLQQRACRSYSVQTLEDRHMLSADFFYDATTDQLILDNFSEVFGEQVTITETATDYRFLLSEGSWNGSDDLDEGIRVIPGQTNDLRVAKNPDSGMFAVNEFLFDDTVGVDYLFEQLDLVNAPTPISFTINTNGGDLAQTALTHVLMNDFTVDGANNIQMREVANEFELITITDANDVTIRDASLMDLGRIQVNNDAEFECNGDMTLTDVFAIVGNVLLNANFGDIIQETDAPLFVTGETNLKSNHSTRGIDLGFGDGDGDGLNDNDFVGHVNVLQGAAIEIVDVNDLLIGDVNTHESADPEVFQLYVEAQNGKVTFDGTVEVEGSADAQGKVIVRATNGAAETSRGRITTDGIILIGEGDFIFDQPNEIFDQDAPSVGLISADISGNLIFNNELALQVSRNSYETLNPNTTVGINSLKIRQLPDGSAGNLTITTSDDDVTQSSLAPVIVESLTTIDIGTGSITWENGDELGNLKNDNDWATLTIVNATNASFVDENSLIISDINATGNARFQAENDNALFLDGNIIVGGNVLFQSDIGASQLSGSVQAAGLMASGSGDFLFSLNNQIGDLTTAGNVAANLRAGEFMLYNLNGIQVTTLSAFGETLVGIDGFQVDKTRLRGSDIQINQFLNATDVFLESESTVTQTSPITAETLMIRTNGDATLTATNEVGTLAAEVEGDFDFNNNMALDIGQLSYDGTTLSGVAVQNGANNNFTITTTDANVNQNLDAPVIVDGTLNVILGLGRLGFDFGDSDGDTVNDNDFNTVNVTSAARVEIVDRNDLITNTITASEQVRLQSETGTIHLEGDLTATNIVLLQAGNGVVQNPGGSGGGGVINTAALMLDGSGGFYLTHDNEIGDAVNKGEIAVNVNGPFELRNIFELTTKNLTFTLRDGSTFTINGFNVNSGGDALILNVFGLTIETEISAPKIIINTQGDIIQAPSGRLITDELVLTGVGDFELTALNRIGTALDPGVVAINVEGNVELLNEFSLNFDEIVNGTDSFLGSTLIAGAFSPGDLTLRTQNGDINQSNDSVFNVAGTTTFDTGTGNVKLLGFALNQNDFNGLSVDSGAIVEIADANGLLIDSTNVSDSMMVLAGGTIPAQIILDDNISVVNQLMLKAELGVSQQRGFIIASTLLLDGASDFDLGLANEVSGISADITGNLNLTNEVPLTIVKDSYTDLDGTMTSFAGIDLGSLLFDGNLTITTSNDDVVQNADAHVQVAETASFDLGTGSLGLTFGDSNTDAINDNDINVLAIASAGTAEFVDQNSIGLDNIDLSGNMLIQSEGGSISIQGQVDADGSMMLESLTGAGTTIGASLSAENLLLTGSGEFNLNGANRVGTASIPGNVGLDVDGNVILHNDFGVHFADVTYTRLDGSIHNLTGADVDASGFNGNLFVMADGGITDSDTVDILVDGAAAFVSGAGSDVDLGGLNQVTASSVGLGGRNVSLMLNNGLVLDGANVTGDLVVQSTGDISQSAVDVSGLAGSRYVIVGGSATFTLESTSGLAEELNINLLSSGGALLNNRFSGATVIQGTSFLGTGAGQLNQVQVRNSVTDTAQFPSILRTGGDQLSSLSVWAPNSSLTISDLGMGTDYDVTGNLTIFAGVDSETEQVGGQLKVTDNAKTRNLRDASGVEIMVDGNLNTNAANTLNLADNADNSIVVGGTLSLVNQGGANENRIRIGVTGGTRGTDSGATVSSSALRTRAFRDGTDGHVTVNLDSPVSFTNSNFATSLVVVADGDISDEATASLAVANGAFFEAGAGANDITLGDDNLTNRTNFGSVGFLGQNVSLTEDTSTLLNGSSVGGDLEALAKGFRQTGENRFGRAGTAFIEVAGNTTLTVDGNSVPNNHLQDPSGRDVMLMNNGSQDLMDNDFGGSITIQSTQKLSGGNGTLRNVAIRNLSPTASVPQFSVDATDQLKSLSIWHPNASVAMGAQTNATDYDVAGNLMVVAGLDSDNGKTNGNKIIVNDLAVRDITDLADVAFSVGRNASFHAANHINLVSDATRSLLVGRTATFVSQGGLQGNQVDVGTAGPRGTDSGGTFETQRLKFTIEDTGVGGDLTVVADRSFDLDPTSSAPSAVLLP